MFFYSEVNNPSGILNVGNTALLLKGEGQFVVDSGPNNYNISAYNVGISTNQKKFGSSSLSFLTAQSYLNIGEAYNIITTGSFTIEAWTYKTNGANGMIAGTFNWQNGNNNGWYMYQGTDNKIYLGGSNGIWNDAATILTSSLTASLNTWNHVAITRDSSNVIRCFINGKLCGSTTYSQTLNRVGGSGTAVQALKVGCYIADGRYYNIPFNGYIDNLRITQNGARYISDFTVPGDF